MALHVAVREERPAVRRRVLPPLVPTAFGHFRADAIDGLLWSGDGVHVGAETDNGSKVLPIFSEFAMESDVVPVSLASADAVEVPESTEKC